MQLLGVFLLTLAAAISEMATISAVVPFLTVISSPETLFEVEFTRRILMAFNIDAVDELTYLATIFFIISAICAGVTRYALMWSQTVVSYAIGSDIAAEMYRRTLYQSYEVHLSRNSSEVLAAINIKVKDVVNQIIGPCITLTSSSILLLLLSGLLFLINPNVAAITFFVFGMVYVVIARSVKKSLVRHGKIMSSMQSKVVKNIQEGLNGIRDVLLTGAQNLYIESFRMSDVARRDATAKIIVISQAPRFVIESGGMVFIALIAYFLIEVRSETTTVLPLLGALALGAQRMLPLLQQAYWSYSQIHGGGSSLRDVIELLDQPTIEKDESTSVEMTFGRTIEFSNIAFSYAGNSTEVLKSINLCIAKGNCIGVIGSTGSGKSTLIDILMGLIKPSSGALLVDDDEVTEEKLVAWQKKIAHVPQSIYLADTTIRQNIAFGIPPDDIDFENVMAAAKLAHIDDVITALENGYETRVGERGIRLSGGQLQRIGIARALYRNAEVLVLDEATSALDQKTEKHIMDCISKLPSSLTVIMIAHRITSLINCDLIIKLENGKISAAGSYSDILDKP
tara:strand:+ start:19071 stop:20774 length:1704 start_codon:yes stop_codon:yes gene_type:complete